VQKFKIDLFLVTSTFFQERNIITLFSIKRSDDWYFPRKNCYHNRKLRRIDTLIKMSGIQ